MSPGESRVGPQEAGGSGVVRWENAVDVPRDKEFVDKKVPRPAGMGSWPPPQRWAHDTTLFITLPSSQAHTASVSLEC